MSWVSLTIVVAVPALLTLYALVYLAATSAHTRMPECIPSGFGGYTGAYRGWDAGVCFTEEQLWCRVHPGKHPACLTADCRAEEVRLSLPGRSKYRGLKPWLNPILRVPVWSGCSAVQLQAIYSRFISQSGWRGACVPLGDKRSTLLRFCEAEEAATAGVFYQQVSDLKSVAWRNPRQNCTVEAGSSEWMCESI